MVSFGTGVEFIGKPFTPLFVEYKYLISEKKTAPFVFIRGGGIVQLGGDDNDSYDYNYDYKFPSTIKVVRHLLQEPEYHGRRRNMRHILVLLTDMRIPAMSRRNITRNYNLREHTEQA